MKIVKTIGGVLVLVGLAIMGYFGAQRNYAFAVTGLVVFAIGAIMVW